MSTERAPKRKKKKKRNGKNPKDSAFLFVSLRFHEKQTLVDRWVLCKPGTEESFTQQITKQRISFQDLHHPEATLTESSRLRQNPRIHTSERKRLGKQTLG